MHHNVDLEYLSLAEAAAVLAAVADQLAAGTLAVDGGHVTVTGPVSVLMDIDASRALAHVTIDIHCHRPDGGSRRLREELARPGG
jgi:hypothetical protein